MDDAGVYRLDDESALVQTVDFFPPVVDDALAYGRIAAANCLSDIWAMGAKPLTAMNLLCYPSSQIPEEVVADILRGGIEKLREAGVCLLGGHTAEQKEILFGMSVTGVMDPARALTNASARPGDKLILTKPLGSGVLSTALRADRVSPDDYQTLVKSLERLNLYASRAATAFDVSAMTDITGYGLMGHSLPMARNAGVSMVFWAAALPLLPGAADLAAEFMPGGSVLNRQQTEPFCYVDDLVDQAVADLAFDAQTSGGLLFAVRPDQAEEALAAVVEAGDVSAAIVGEVFSLPEAASAQTAHPLLSLIP